MWYAYHGNSWHYHTQDLLKKPLREIVEHKHGDYYLVFGLAGDALMMHEMHPSWVNINPMHYYGRYCGRMYENGFNQFAGYGRHAGPGMASAAAAGPAATPTTRSPATAAAASSPRGRGSSRTCRSAGASAPLIDADADQGHISVRRDFSDSAFWNATVRTDEDGKASVEFKLPDSLTNWQVVVTAVSQKMHVGQAKASFRTFKPIMVWPMLPRTFTEGDRVEVFGSVHNRTDEGQNIKVRLKVENGEILSPEEKTVWVDAEVERERLLDLRGPAARVHATADVGRLPRRLRRLAQAAAGHPGRGRADHHRSPAWSRTARPSRSRTTSI